VLFAFVKRNDALSETQDVTEENIWGRVPTCRIQNFDK